MNTWMIIATFMVALGLVACIVFSIMDEEIHLEPFLISLGALAVEGVTFGMTKLIAWVLTWNATLIVKMTFLMMPASLILGIIFFIIAGACDKDGWFIVAFLMALLLIASGISCMVFTWVTSIAWRIAILTIVGLVVILLVVVAAIDNRPYAVGYGDHCEVVEYYPSRRAYRRAQKEPKYDPDDWAWGGPAV